MVFESDKIMFEIYKDTLYKKDYRVVYYTELTEHNKHIEINRAMAGEHYFDGFIKDYRKDDAKKIIEKIISDLNDGNMVKPEEIREMLREFIP
jgi:hypothetical protein